MTEAKGVMDITEDDLMRHLFISQLIYNVLFERQTNNGRLDATARTLGNTLNTEKGVVRQLIMQARENGGRIRIPYTKVGGAPAPEPRTRRMDL